MICFCLVQVNVNTIDNVNDFRKTIKINFYIAIDMNRKVLLYRLIQKFHATKSICRIDSVITITRNLNI